ncbi:MAG: TlpA family protein disulfide reductase [Gammaproteobacteria bacterium]
MTRREILGLVLTCAVAAAAGFAGYRAWQLHLAAEAASARPDLEFRDLDGQPHRLSEWNGKLLLLNFWATWCPPCVKEIPLLVEAQKQHGARGLQVVGIAMDEVEPVRIFAARMNMNYPVMVGQADIARAMDALGDQLGAFPFSVLISPDGRILGRSSGDLSREEITEWLDKHLPISR